MWNILTSSLVEVPYRPQKDLCYMFGDMTSNQIYSAMGMCLM